MTTNKFIEMLRAADPEGTRQVVLQGDSEGNHFSKAHSVWTGAFSKRGDAGIDKLTPQDEERGYSKEDVVKGSKAIFIVPE